MSQRPLGTIVLESLEDGTIAATFDDLCGLGRDITEALDNLSYAHVQRAGGSPGTVGAVSEIAWLEDQITKIPPQAVLTRTSLQRRIDILRQELEEEAEQAKFRAGCEAVYEEDRAALDFLPYDD